MESICYNISTLAIAAAVLIPRLFPKRRNIGLVLSALCYLAVIILRALALLYSFSPTGIVIIALAAVALFCVGVKVGRRITVRRDDQNGVCIHENQ